jgi:hypothetical protein
LLGWPRQLVVGVPPTGGAEAKLHHRNERLRRTDRRAVRATPRSETPSLADFGELSRAGEGRVRALTVCGRAARVLARSSDPPYVFLPSPLAGEGLGVRGALSLNASPRRKREDKSTGGQAASATRLCYSFLIRERSARSSRRPDTTGERRHVDVHRRAGRWTPLLNV